MNFDEWYRQSPTRLCGPTEEDLERGRKLRERVYVENRTGDPMNTTRRPYAPPPSLEDAPESGDYDDLPPDRELDFNVDISDRWSDAPEAA